MVLFVNQLTTYAVGVLCMIVAITSGTFANLFARSVSHIDTAFVALVRALVPIACFIVLSTISSVPFINKFFGGKSLLSYFFTKNWGLQLCRQMLAASWLILFVYSLHKGKPSLAIMSFAPFIPALFANLFSFILLLDFSIINRAQIVLSAFAMVIFFQFLPSNCYQMFFPWYILSGVVAGLGDVLTSYLTTKDLDRKRTLLYKIYPINEPDNVGNSAVYGVVLSSIVFSICLPYILFKYDFGYIQAQLTECFNCRAQFFLGFISNATSGIMFIVSFWLLSASTVQSVKVFQVPIGGIGDLQSENKLNCSNISGILPPYIGYSTSLIAIACIMTTLIKAKVINNWRTCAKIIFGSIFIILCICDIFHTENHLFTLRNRLWISIMLGYTMICRPKWFFVMLTFYLLTQQLTSRLIYDILAK